jgi:hypothetical protein
MESRIKNWIKFNESQLDMFSGTSYEYPDLKYKNIYLFSPEEIEDQFIDFIDDGWVVTIAYGFNYNSSTNLPDIELLITKRKVIPVIRVYIHGFSGKSKGGDWLTDSLLSSLDRLEPRFKKITVMDDGGILNPEELKFEGSSIYIKSENDNPEDDLEIEGSLIIDFTWIKEIELTDKMIFNFYNLEDNFKPEDLTYKGEEVIIGFPVTEIKDWVLDKRSSHLDIVGNPDNLDWSYYDDYDVDDDSFFRYHLDSETKKLLIEKLIGDKFETYQEDYDFLNEFNTIEDLIKYTINPGYQYKSLYRDLGKMLSEEEVYENLKQMYSDYYNEQKMEDDYNVIMTSFHQIVEDVLHTKIIEEYQKENKLWYKIKFNFEWLEYEDDAEYIMKEGLNYIISNWCYKNYDLRELKPYFSDYASIDGKAFNEECRKILSNL